jgi:GTPase SAR1 family protein
MVKVLMLGPPASGKTSIRYCFFKGIDAESVMKQPPEPTVREEERFDHIDFFLRIVDLGGQKSFMETWSGDKEEELFKAVDVIIFVVDAADTYHRNVLRAIRMLQGVVSSVSKYSPEARVHILLHKMDIAGTGDALKFFTEEFNKAISSSPLEQMTVFHRTSIVDGTSNRALRSILNEVMPRYDTHRQTFEKIVNENRDIEIIQLLAPRKQDTGGKEQALVVAEAISPHHNCEDNALKPDFTPLLRSIDNSVKKLDDSGMEYSLMKMRNGRIIIFKDLGKYYIVVESKEGSEETLFLSTIDQLFTAAEDIERLAS